MSFYNGLVTLDVHCMVSFRSGSNKTLKLSFEIKESLHKRRSVDITGKSMNLRDNFQF